MKLTEGLKLEEWLSNIFTVFQASFAANMQRTEAHRSHKE
jgi:hypothetical protein